jgi:hypothetical protein
MWTIFVCLDVIHTHTFQNNYARSWTPIVENAFSLAIVKLQKDVIYWIFCRSIIISGNMTFNKKPIRP